MSLPEWTREDRGLPGELGEGGGACFLCFLCFPVRFWDRWVVDWEPPVLDLEERPLLDLEERPLD